MPAPYDYTVGQPPALGFLQSLQAVAPILQMRQEQAAAQAKMERQRAFQQAIAAAKADPSKIPDLYAAFPEAREGIKAWADSLSEADKNTYGGAARDAFRLLRSGKTEDAAAALETRATAADNSNRPDLAKAMRDAAQVLRTDPETGTLSVNMLLQQLDPKAYEAFVGDDHLTSFQRDQRAAGVDPYSEAGVEQANQYLQTKVDPVVTMETPRGTTFVGPFSEYQRLYGGGSAAPKPPAIGEVRQSSEGPVKFKGGNPALKENWEKVTGGVGSNAGGNFRE
jgi:hypothetical protein